MRRSVPPRQKRFVDFLVVSENQNLQFVRQCRPVVSSVSVRRWQQIYFFIAVVCICCCLFLLLSGQPASVDHKMIKTKDVTLDIFFCKVSCRQINNKMISAVTGHRDMHPCGKLFRDMKYCKHNRSLHYGITSGIAPTHRHDCWGHGTVQRDILPGDGNTDKSDARR